MKQQRLVLAELCCAVKQAVRAHSSVKVPAEQILPCLGNPKENNVRLSNYLVNQIQWGQ